MVWERISQERRCHLLYIFSTIMKNAVKSLHWYYYHKHCMLQWTWFSIPCIHTCISVICMCNLCAKMKLNKLIASWIQHRRESLNTEKWDYDYKLYYGIVIEALGTFSSVLRFLPWWTQNQYFTSPKMKFRIIVHFYHLYCNYPFFRRGNIFGQHSLSENLLHKYYSSTKI